VHEQEGVVLELPDQVLAAARQALDAAALNGVDDRLGRERQAPARVGDLQPCDDTPLDEGRELAADRLDLGELRNGYLRGASGPAS
jgi:hypothetical protein